MVACNFNYREPIDDMTVRLNSKCESTQERPPAYFIDK